MLVKRVWGKEQVLLRDSWMIESVCDVISYHIFFTGIFRFYRYFLDLMLIWEQFNGEVRNGFLIDLYGEWSI